MAKLSDARILAQAGGNIVPTQSTPREFDHGAHIRELKRAARSSPTIRTRPAGGKARAE